jgi:hypothetical protein
MASSTSRSVVATTTSSTAARAMRSKCLHNTGWPATSISNLPGKRLEAQRACTTATILIQPATQKI